METDYEKLRKARIETVRAVLRESQDISWPPGQRVAEAIVDALTTRDNADL